MAFPRKFYPDAVPAPLRIPPKPPRRPSSPSSASTSTSTSIWSEQRQFYDWSSPATMTSSSSSIILPVFSPSCSPATSARCHSLSRLPPQPVFASSSSSSSFECQEVHTPLSPTIPLSAPAPLPISPLSLSSPRGSFMSSRSSYSSSRSSSSSSSSSPFLSRGPQHPGRSLDFSALSMRSPALRQDLENCQCHLSSRAPAATAEDDFISRQIASLRRGQERT